MFTSLNISEKIFFNDYILNTTRVDLYSNKASIYINNNTFSRHHITLGDSSEFKKIYMQIIILMKYIINILIIMIYCIF